MLNARSQVYEIIRAEGMRFVAVLQSACAVQNKIRFLLHDRRERFHTLPWASTETSREARHTSQNPIVRVTGAEDWLVVAGCPRIDPVFVSFRLGTYRCSHVASTFLLLGRETETSAAGGATGAAGSWQFVSMTGVLRFVRLRTLVYHRICLTQIEIFRFIRIRFVCDEISASKSCVLLSTAQPLSPSKSDHDTPFCAIELTKTVWAGFVALVVVTMAGFLCGVRPVNPQER